MSSHSVQEYCTIHVGNIRAIVSNVHSPDHVEIAYANNSGRYVAEDAISNSGTWRLLNNAVDATYADRSPRLQHFVYLLCCGNQQ